MITLSTLEYDILWEHLELGPFPTVLQVPSRGTTGGERAELARRAWESLADKEFGWPRLVDGRIVFALRQLARPELELDLRLRRATGPRVGALIAATTSTATVAVLDGARLTLRAIRSDVITAEAAALLPSHPTGTGGSITFPASTLDTAAARAGTDPAELTRHLHALGLGKSESRKVTDVAGGVVRFAHFGAARTAKFDKRVRAGHAVSVYDGESGRYLFTRKQGWVTLVPGSPGAVIRQLDELLSSFT